MRKLEKRFQGIKNILFPGVSCTHSRRTCVHGKYAPAIKYILFLFSLSDSKGFLLYRQLCRRVASNLGCFDYSLGIEKGPLLLSMFFSISFHVPHGMWSNCPQTPQV